MVQSSRNDIDDVEDAIVPLVGTTAAFYGVCGNEFKLGDVVYDAKEDESDGYRSYLGSVDVSRESTGTFFRAPIATVRVDTHETDLLDVYRLVDVEDGHVWLEFGTDNSCDYYPFFVFRYEPKAQAT